MNASKLVITGSFLFPLGMLLVVSLGLLSSEQSLSREEILYIQRVLCSNPTGELDANTRQALRSYQRSKGIAANTVLDGDQIERLLQEEPCRPGRRTFYENTLQSAQIRNLQLKLGVEPNGVLDGPTRRALLAFQERRRSALRDGIITPALVQQIADARAIPNPPPQAVFGLGLVLSEGDGAWVRVNRLSAASSFTPGTLLQVTALGAERHSLQVAVEGEFSDENPRRILQISWPAALQLHLQNRSEAAIMVEQAQNE